MKRYFIEEAKCGITEGGIGIGPVPGNVVVSLKFQDGTRTQWLNVVEVDGIPNVYLSDEDIFDPLLAEDLDDEDFTEYMLDHYITEFEGIVFDTDYEATFESISENPDNPAVPLIRCIIALVRCSMDETEELIQMMSGKYADEVEIPVSDVEEEYLEDYENE